MTGSLHRPTYRGCRDFHQNFGITISPLKKETPDRSDNESGSARRLMRPSRHNLADR